jgi:hypothetical protein
LVRTHTASYIRRHSYQKLCKETARERERERWVRLKIEPVLAFLRVWFFQFGGGGVGFVVLGNGSGKTEWQDLLGEAAGFREVAVAQATRGKWEEGKGEQRINKPLRKSVLLH